MEKQLVNIFVLHSLNGDTLKFWGADIKQEFDKTVEVYLPEFPIRAESAYQKFYEILSHYFDDGRLNKDSIVICHSIGVPYFVRFSKAHKFVPKAFISVAPGAIYPYDDPTRNDYIVEARAQALPKPEDFAWVKNNIKNKWCLYSDEDSPIKRMHSEMFAREIGAQRMYLKGYNHFSGYNKCYKIPELKELVKKLI